LRKGPPPQEKNFGKKPISERVGTILALPGWHGSCISRKGGGLAQNLPCPAGTVPVFQEPCQAVRKGSRMHFYAVKLHFLGTWHGFSTL